MTLKMLEQNGTTISGQEKIMSELKSCPFCGGDDVKKISIDAPKDVRHTFTMWQILCFSCKASGPESTVSNIAVAYWNAAERAETENNSESTEELC